MAWPRWGILLQFVLIFTDNPVQGDIFDLLDLYKDDLPQFSLEPTECLQYDDPMECRRSKCFFSCDSRQCDSKNNTCSIRSKNEEERDTCHQHCFDVCSCRRLGPCEYDVAGGDCFETFPENGMECGQGLFQDWECLQKDKFYIDAGVPCKMLKSSGDCTFAEQIRAVNLNGDNFTDELRDIWYRADQDIPYLDPNNTRVPGKFSGELRGPSGDNGKQAEIYSTYIKGSKSNAMAGRCITYIIPIKFVSYYELTIKMAEFVKTAAGQRFFTVKLNNMPILLEFDLLKVAGDAAVPADFVLFFYISEHGYLFPKGLLPSKVRNGQISLSFCYGSCDKLPDKGYIVSAFHILRVRASDPNPPPITGTTTEGSLEGSTDGTGITSGSTRRPGVTSSTDGPVVPPTGGGGGDGTNCKNDGHCTECSDDYQRLYGNCTDGNGGGGPPTDKVCRELYGGDLCGCKGAGCDYNIKSGTCRLGKTFCDELPLTDADCRKSGTITAHSGILCPRTEDAGNCNLDKVIYAVNINGPGYTDTSGVEYQADSASLYHDRFSARRDEMEAACKDDAPISGIGDEDIHLYSNIMFGDPERKVVSDAVCVSYPIKLAADAGGRYLLTIKAVETFVTQNKTRFFNVKFNGILILPEVDLVRVRGHCAAADFLVNFNISKSGDDLSVSGHPTSRIMKGKTMLQFCFSGCEVPQRNFISSAFSLVKLKPVGKDGDGSGEDGGSTTENSNQEVTTITQEPGATMSPTPPPPTSCPKETGTVCLRGDSWYNIGGVLCKTSTGEGNCNVTADGVALAVNLNGPEHLDSSGILHVQDMAYLYTDKDNTRQEIHVDTWKTSQCKEQELKGVDPQDKDLYSTLIIGKSGEQGMGKCISYHVNISRDGRYEFNVRTMETFWTDSVGGGVKPRQFNIRLNGMVIWPELNIRHNVAACEGMSLLAEFDVGAGQLTPVGFPGSPLAKNGRVDVEFCYGDGGPDKPAVYDPNYIAASFYIVELEGSPTTSKPGPEATTTEGTISTIFPEGTKSPTGTDSPGGTKSPTGTDSPTGTESPNTKCAHYTTAVECKKPGDCEWNGTCVPTPKEPEKCPGTESLTTCQRGGGYYTVGGVLCKSDNPGPGDTGNCEVKRLVKAVNLNGPSHNDSRNIRHEAEKTSHYTDKYSSRQGIQVDTWANSNCKGGVTGIPEQDNELFSSLIVARSQPTEGKGKCIAYHTKITENGRFELNVRTVETFWVDSVGNGAKPRQFNIRLNGQLIFPELNILHKVKACEGISLFTEFEVADGILTPAGFDQNSSSPIPKTGGVDLEFCYGDDPKSPQYDPNYIVSSFYIVELHPSTPTTTTPNPEMSTTKTTTTTTTTTTTPKSILSTTLKPIHPKGGPKLPSHKKCLKRDTKTVNGFCQCVDPSNRCDAFFHAHDDGTGEYECVLRHQWCHELTSAHLKIMFPGNSCRRARGAYSYGGLLCNNENRTHSDVMYTKEDTGDCKILDTIMAVRFNGQEPYLDSRGITFQPMSADPPKNAKDYQLNYERLRYSKGIMQCQESNADLPKKTYHKKDLKLWEYYVTGKNTSDGPCLNFTIPIKEDGTYEFSFKTVEYEYDSKDERAFNVYLNGIRVMPEVDIYKNWVAVCVATEFISVFEVTGGLGWITPRGFLPHRIGVEGVEVSFCKGTCRGGVLVTGHATKTWDFLGVAFSVLKMNTYHNID